MAVTITAGELAVAIRAAAAADAVPDQVATTLGFLMPAAAAMLLDYAPAAPDAVHNAALIRLAGWLYDADPTDSRVSNAIHVSGATNLLASWREHRAGIIGNVAAASGGGTGPVTPGAGLPDLPSSGSWTLIVNNGELEWIKFPLPA